MALNRWDTENHNIRRQLTACENILLGLRDFGVHTGDTVTYIKRKMADSTRQLNNFYYKDTMNDDIYEFRYEAHDGVYKLKCWHDGKENTKHGSVATQPEWLTGIVDVARVAGHLKTPITPPPEVILWFHTDKNHTLINFIELA